MSMKERLQRIPEDLRIPIATGALFAVIEILTAALFVWANSDPRYAEGIGFAVAYCFAYHLPILIVSAAAPKLALILVPLWTILLGFLLGGLGGAAGAPIARLIFPKAPIARQAEIALRLVGSLFLLIAAVNYMTGSQHDNLAGMISVLIGPRIGLALLLAPTFSRWTFQGMRSNHSLDRPAAR